LTSSRMRSAFSAAACATLVFVSGCSGIAAPDQGQSAFPSPVAFVTPAVPPAAPPTATAPPLPTATPPPATAVPRKEPQTTLAATGLWSDVITDAVAFPGFLDIATGPRATDYRNAKNAFLLTLGVSQAQTGYTANITDVLTANADWVLYDARNRLARAANGEPMLNIRNETVRTQIAEYVATAAESFDGVLLSGVGDELIRSTNTPVFTGTRAFTDQQRRDAVETLIRAVRARAPAKVIVIGGYAWRDGGAYFPRADEARDLAAIVDGLHIEAFVRSPLSATTSYKGETAWRRDVDMLSAVSADNRIVLVTTRLNGTEAGPDLTRQWLSFALTSFLLGKNGSKTYFQFDGGDLALSADAALGAPLGAPIEAYSRLESGVYTRRFERGLVLVNASAEDKTATLDGNFRTLTGNEVNTSVTLTPRTGLILIRQAP
jgi:Hypothetical glycosyl hydrolase family 15